MVREVRVSDELAGQGSELLVSRARLGERAAFEELYRRYYPAVVRRLSHLLGPAGPVADLVQETFEQALRGLVHLRSEACFGHWLLRIAQNVARAHHRKRRRSLWRLWEQPEQEQEVPARGADADESLPSLRLVHAALERLSPRLREAVVLHELEGLSLAEMAAALEIPLHTAASRLRRGRDRLREELERLGAVFDRAPGAASSSPAARSWDDPPAMRAAAQAGAVRRE
jgi:RNA polymerase sigma-70 factor (ECF subfamily)